MRTSCVHYVSCNTGSFKVKQKRSSQIFKVEFFAKTDTLKISRKAQNGETIQTEVRAGDQGEIQRYMYNNNDDAFVCVLFF